MDYLKENTDSPVRDAKFSGKRYLFNQKEKYMQKVETAS